MDPKTQIPSTHARYCLALSDPIAFSLEVYPDMILFQTGEDGIMNRLDIEVLLAVSTNNGYYSLCVNKTTMLNNR